MNLKLKKTKKNIENIVLVDTTVSGSLHTSKTAGSMGPLGLQYISSYLSKKGFNVIILEQNSQNLNDFKENILSYSPDLVGFSNMLVKWEDQNKLAGLLNKNIYTIVGGPGISGDPLRLNGSNFDYGIKGEGELVLERVINSINKGKIDKNLAGLIYRNKGGIKINLSERLSEQFISKNNIPSKIENKESGNFSQMTGIEYKVLHHELEIGQLNYSRGCPNNCAFCDVHNLWGRKVKWASPKSITQAMTALKIRGTNYLFFTDLTFNLDKKRVLNLSNEIIKERIGLDYFVQATVKNTDDEILDSLVESGCKKIHFGIESLTEHGLKLMNKSYKEYEQGRNALDLANKKGLITRAYMIMPWKSKKELENFEYNLKNLPADEIRLSFMTPFPGTKVWEEYSSRVTSRDLKDYGGDYPLINFTGIENENLIKYRNNIVRSFYNSKEYKERISAKIKQFSHLKKSYEHFLSIITKND